MATTNCRLTRAIVLLCLVITATAMPQASVFGRPPARATMAAATGVSRSGSPIAIPSLAAQSINPIFRLSNGLTLPQAAFNTAVTGQSIRSLPADAFGFNPYAFPGGRGFNFPMFTGAATFGLNSASLTATSSLRTTSAVTTTSSATTTPTSSTTTTVSRSGTPISIPSLATQSINPIFQIAPGLTLPQAAFNTQVLGQALRSVPPYAFGFSRFGGGYGIGGGYPIASPYMGGGYGYAPAMAAASPASGGGGQSLVSPYYMGSGSDADFYTAYPPTSNPAGSSSQGADNAGSPVADASKVSSDSGQEQSDSTRSISLYDNFFSSSSTTVPVGTTVRWVNYGYKPHSVTSQDGLWDSGTLKHNAEFSITFKAPGTYRYVSSFQPRTMTATITVTK
jgi:plastocyanin